MSTKDDFVAAFRAALPNFNKVQRSDDLVAEAIGAALEAVLAKNYGLIELEWRKEEEDRANFEAARAKYPESLMREHMALSQIAAQSSTMTWLPNPQHLHAVAVERTRQIAKGYDATHDDKQTNGLLLLKAADYVRNAEGSVDDKNPAIATKHIVSAIALLFAELERLDRASSSFAAKALLNELQNPENLAHRGQSRPVDGCECWTCNHIRELDRAEGK